MSNSISRCVVLMVFAIVPVAAAQDSTPRALFTITPADPQAGQEVALDASFSFDRGSGGSIILYSWDFGDGSDVVALDHPTTTHTYAAAGLYTIALTVVDDDTPSNQGVTERTIVVVAVPDNAEVPNQLPKAQFTLSTTQAAAGDEVTFDASASTDEDGVKACSIGGAACTGDADCPEGETCAVQLQYAWDFGDGTTQDFTTDPVATHAYSEPKKYEVRLFVCDQATCTLGSSTLDVSETFQEIEVLAAGTNVAPIAIIASGPRIGTVGETLTFDGQLSFDPNGDQLEFAWDVRFNDLLIDQVLTSVMTRSFDQVGTYEIALEVFDGRGGSDRTDPIMVVIAEAPPVVEPPAANPNPGNTLEEPMDSALQRPTLMTCGVGMIPAMMASMLVMAAMFVTRRRSRR